MYEATHARARSSAPLVLIVSVTLALASAACTEAPGSAPDGATPSRDDGGRQGGGRRDGGGGSVVGPPPVPFDVELGEVTIVDPPTALPPVAALDQVTAYVEGDTLRAMVFPIAEARDYRIYELPDDGDVVDLGGGDFAIEQGTYRCSGMRYAPRVATDNEPYDATYTGHTIVNGMVAGVRRTEADATLGYVSLTQVAGTVPLYALGSAYTTGDAGCEHQMRFAASRVKRYTTRAADRDAMLAAGWRDDGIIGYVPESGGTQIYEQREHRGDVAADPGRVLYFTASERASREGAVEAFSVFDTPAAGRQPLERVFYDVVPCAMYPHDELAVGEARYRQAVHQGPQPYPNVAWSGLRARGRYVVEALDALCPYQGLMVTMDSAAGESAGTVRRTEAQIRAGAAHGELFINGQGDPANHPRVLARLILEAEPVHNSVEDMAFHATFRDTSLFDGLTVDRGNYFDRWRNDAVDISVIIFDWYSFGITHDELWFSFMETNGSNGKFRITPTRTADLSASSFVHATMSVDSFSGERRYPQIIVTDSDIALPIQKELGGDPTNMTHGNSVVMQPFGSWPSRVEIEFCDHQDWDVNNQCPRFEANIAAGTSRERWLPHHQASEDGQLGWRNRFDVFVSTERVYLFVDYQPFSCSILPGTGLAPGPGHVSFGTVLYHAGAHPDVNSYEFYEFHNRHMITGTRRFFDDLGFQDGVAPPEWDESRFPCSTETRL